MKAGIHPEYRDVVFHDTAANVKWMTRSTLHTSRKITMDDVARFARINRVERVMRPYLEAVVA